MKPSRLPSLLTLLLLALAFASGPALRAQEAPPAPPAPAAEKKPDEPAVAPAEPAPAASADKVTDAIEKVQDKTGDIVEKITDKVDEKLEQTDRKLRRLDRKGSRGLHISVDTDRRRRRSGEAPPFGDHTVGGSQQADESVSVFGNTTVEGTVMDAAVSVFGNTTVNGTVGDAAVSVFGTTTVNGTVKGEAVAVFGNIILGPKAVVEGDMTVVFGRIERDPAAQAKGSVNVIGGMFSGPGDFTWLRVYMTKCVLWGRMLWVGEDLGWAWVVAGAFLLLYLLLALLFPRGIERSVEVLEERPGGTVLTAFLTMLLSPFLLILLAVTVVGIPLIPVVAVLLLVGTIFGKAAVHAWLGRRLAHAFNRDAVAPTPVVAVLIGGVFITLLYLVPFLGLLLWKLFGLLGLGMVTYRLLLSMQREKAPVAAVATGAAEPPLAAGPEGAALAPALPAGLVPPPPPLISAATLPRAGFWIRLAAVLLDLVLFGVGIGITTGFFHRLGFHPGEGFPFWFAVYNIVMWATKGTTFGGMICGLKIVRLDDRRLDWSIATVRAVTGFLSLVVAGLGYIWVVFDDGKQSWHDKVAGTTIVRVPRGTPLF